MPVGGDDGRSSQASRIAPGSQLPRGGCGSGRRPRCALVQCVLRKHPRRHRDCDDLPDRVDVDAFPVGPNIPRRIFTRRFARRARMQTDPREDPRARGRSRPGRLLGSHPRSPRPAARPPDIASPAAPAHSASVGRAMARSTQGGSSEADAFRNNERASRAVRAPFNQRPPLASFLRALALVQFDSVEPGRLMRC